jgi:homoserine kinase
MTPPESATAYAPASVGNVAVGFDILGHSVDVVGDRVRATRSATRGVRISSVSGVVTNLPREAARNAASTSVLALIDSLGIDHGFDLDIDKGIPLGSGLGGSAASAVAGVFAAASLLPRRPDLLVLLKCAMKGEEAACGTAHVDNIASSLYGGLVLTVGIDDPRVRRIPVPPDVRCVLVRPHMELATRVSRQVLQKTLQLSDVVWQTANLAGVITGCFTNDLPLIRASLEDVVIEPQRRSLVPGFDDVKSAAISAGALGCSISGGGPTIFAWVEEHRAEAVRAAMVERLELKRIHSDSWIAPVGGEGARLIGS